MTPDEIVHELRVVRDDFHALLDGATSAELRGPTDGTKWTNEQLLFHMLFGYLLVRNLRPLVYAFAILPRACSRWFAATLDAGTRPFHVVNYLGSLGGARALGHARMERLMDQVVDSLTRSATRATQGQLGRGMHFPVGWDPYFRDFMTVREIYHYPTQHYLHHRSQLTLSNKRPISPTIPVPSAESRPPPRSH